MEIERSVHVKNRTELNEQILKLKNTFDMKNKRLNTRKLKYVFYTLLTCVMCVGCADSHRDVKTIQKEFEKGYTTTDTIQGIELDEFIKYHKTHDAIHVYTTGDGG